MTMPSFILPANGKATPKSIERKRRIAEAMMAQGMQTGPIGHWTQGLARMAQALSGGIASRRADSAEAEGQQSARDAMAKALNGGDKASLIDAASNPFMDNNSMSLINDQWSRMNPDPLKPTTDIQNYEYGLENPGFVNHVGNDAEYGLQPIVTQEGPNDPNPGKYHLYQAGKAGQAPKEIELPYGWTPKMQFLNQETQFAPVATQGVLQPGQGPSPVPINNTQAAADTKLGGEQGTAAALHASLSSKLPGLQKVVTDLESLADQATYTQTGQAYNTARKELGMDPTAAAVARAEYIAMVDNQVLPMLRDTFGAQFTVVEGQTLRATLGDPNKTPAEKKAVLRSFINQKIRDIEASGIQGKVDPTQAQPVPQPMPDVSTMSVEDLEAIINGP